MKSSEINTLVETVRKGAHFYMAHRMREYPHPDAPDITMGEHTPGPDCPGCVAEAALSDLAARARNGEKLEQAYTRELAALQVAEADRDAWKTQVTELEAALRAAGELFALLATNQDDESDYVYVMRSDVRRIEAEVDALAGDGGDDG